VSESLFQRFPMLPGRRAQAWRHQPAFRRPRHFHAEPELNVVCRGSARVGLGDSVVHLTSGEVILFHPGQDHVLLEASPDLELWVLALRADLAARAVDSLTRAASVRCRLPAPVLSALVETLASLESVSDADTVEMRLVGQFLQVQGHLSTNHVLSRRALQAVNADLDTPGAELAQRLGVDPSMLSRQFHEAFAVTFVSYRARQRAMAFIRLVDSGLTLTRAATEAGFGSYAQCHRVLTKAFGCPPNRYFAGERVHIDDAIDVSD